MDNYLVVVLFCICSIRVAGYWTSQRQTNLRTSYRSIPEVININYLTTLHYMIYKKNSFCAHIVNIWKAYLTLLLM